jgi:AraC family transcriptional regulator, positive regulator of tynA and feaB
MQKLFECSGASPRDALQAWAAMSSREFFDGDLDTSLDQVPDLAFSKSMGSPIAVTRLTCNAPIGYRRSWQHIRSNKVGVRVIWFVRRGSLKICRTQGDTVIGAGSAGILNSNVPFHTRISCDQDHGFDALQVIVPPSLFLESLASVENCNDAFDLDCTAGHTVNALLDFVSNNGDNLGSSIAEPLSVAILQAIADLTGVNDREAPRRQRIVDKRLEDVENYILMNLTDPDLCYDKVAESCGISPRYLCYVLKAHNTSFSELLWKNRLPKARDWLVSQTTRDYPIHEIAFMAGFKSAAHFSRMFKAAYGCPPRQYRAAHLPAEKFVQATLYRPPAMGYCESGLDIAA